MPLYEFQCHKGHQFEELVPSCTEYLACPQCVDAMQALATIDDICRTWNPMAKRVLSATRTDFRFADTKLKR